MADIWCVSSPNSPAADVIFLHGLMGGARATWTATNGFLWPTALARDFGDVRVLSVSYSASWSRWGKGAMTIRDYAKSIADLLVLHGVGNGRPVVFVCHSLGGLVAKEILYQAATTSLGDDCPSLKGQVRGLFFLGTPHRGSKVALLRHLLRVLLLKPTALIGELSRYSKSAEACHKWFRDAYGRGAVPPFEVVAYHETRPTHGVIVVSEHSADPELPGVTCVPLEMNHNELSKPVDRGSQVYLRLMLMLSKWGIASRHCEAEVTEPRVLRRIDLGCHADCAGREEREAAKCRYLDGFPPQLSVGASHHEDLKTIARIVDWVRDHCHDTVLSGLAITLAIALLGLAFVLAGPGRSLGIVGVLGFSFVATLLVRRRRVIRGELLRSAREAAADLDAGKAPQWGEDCMSWLNSRGFWRWLS